MNKKIVLSLGLLVSISALRAETAPTEETSSENATQEKVVVAMQAPDQQVPLMTYCDATELLRVVLMKSVINDMPPSEFDKRFAYFVENVVMKAKTKEEQDALIKGATFASIASIELSEESKEAQEKLETAGTTQADDKGKTADEAVTELGSAGQPTDSKESTDQTDNPQTPPAA